MSDNFCGQIWIGGKISSAVAEALIAEINRSEAPLEWGDAAVKLSSIAELHQCIEADSAESGHPVLRFRDAQAHNGVFEGLEMFCRDNGLTYVRDSEAHCEYPGEEVWWEPGMDGPDYRYVDPGTAPVITTESIWPVKELLEAALNNSSSWKKQVQSALNKLNELDKSPPSLPKFEVTE
jgi:hypothetical protein